MFLVCNQLVFFSFLFSAVPVLLFSRCSCFQCSCFPVFILVFFKCFQLCSCFLLYSFSDVPVFICFSFQMFLFQCSCFPLFSFSDVPVFHCSPFQMFLFSIVLLFRCSCFPLFPFSDVPVSLHLSFQMFLFSSFPIFRCSCFPVFQFLCSCCLNAEARRSRLC